jgi:hypothetical protein
MIVLPFLALVSMIQSMPREYIVDFKNAGENVAAYKLTVTVVTQRGVKANIDFPVPVAISAGELRDAVYAALKDCRGIEVKLIGDDLLRVKGTKNDRLMRLRIDGNVLQQLNSLKEYPVVIASITLRRGDK